MLKDKRSNPLFQEIPLKDDECSSFCDIEWITS